MTTNPTNIFKQPLYYLDESEIHPIRDSVDHDLEFHSRETSPGAIDLLCTPSTSFAKRQCMQVQHFTSNIEYLEQTQLLLSKLNPTLFHSTSGIFSPYDSPNPREYEAFTNPEIKAKYGFLEWASLDHLNTNPMFLQCMSYVHLTSPILSFLIPIVFFIIPFFLLKLQNIPITFQQYIETLRTIAKHHFIGKMLNVKSFSLENISYILFLAAIYGIQLYQNYYACIHFYQNMKLLNSNLNSLKTYLRETQYNMSRFIELCSENKMHTCVSGYQSFICHLERKLDEIREINSMLSPITDKFISFSNITKIQEFGYLLKCYYTIYNMPQLRETIEYAFDFDGYLQNMTAIHLKMASGDVHCASFISPSVLSSLNEDDDFCDDSEENDGEKKDEDMRDDDATNRKNGEYSKIIDQYYVFLSREPVEPVKNSIHFEKGNMIITGVNASGKTTVLKTTALNIIFSQIYGIGFYREAAIHPYNHIHSYLNIPDTSGRDSLFQAESRRCKEIIDSVERNPKDKRHFCIFDELYSGTNPREATKSAYSFLNYLLKKQNVDFMLTTHYVALCHKFTGENNSQDQPKHISLYQMQVDIGDKGDFFYKYELKSGICELEGGVEILKQMNYPDDIINEMQHEINDT